MKKRSDKIKNDDEKKKLERNVSTEIGVILNPYDGLIAMLLAALRLGAIMILFLDFDGVLHPYSARNRAGEFCYLPMLENVLGSYPMVRIVISSSQRETHSLEALRAHFSPEIANRIIGVTPSLPIYGAVDIAGSRHREILAYLDGANTAWLALDDDGSLYPPGCPDLILCADGFLQAEAEALRCALQKKRCVPA